MYFMSDLTLPGMLTGGVLRGPHHCEINRIDVRPALASLPLLIVFLYIQRYIVSGLGVGAVK
jgi:ABC-type maltose transport system permease subunit